MVFRIENLYYKLLDMDEEIVEDFELMLWNVREMQLELLCKILEWNVNVEYLQCQGLNGCIDEVFFKVCVFVSIYVNIEVDVDCIVDGDIFLICCVDFLIFFVFRLYICIFFYMFCIFRVLFRFMFFVFCIFSCCVVLCMEVNIGSVIGKG